MSTRSLDSLVLEYLETNCPEKKRFRMDDVTPEVPSKDMVTLIDIYKFYQKYHGTNHADEELDEEDTNSQLAKNVQLPNEIVVMILESSARQDLIQWRRVNRNWKQMTFSSIRLMEEPIQFLDAAAVSSFLSTLETEAIRDAFPVSSFEFRNLNGIDTHLQEQFFDALGEQITFLSLHVQKSTYEGCPLNDLDYFLAICPNLKKLRLVGFSGWDEAYNFGQPHYKLHSLTILPDKSSENIDLELTVLHKWLKQAPALRELECGFAIVETSDPVFANLLGAMSHLNLVKLNIPPVQMKGLIDARLPLKNLHTLELKSMISEEPPVAGEMTWTLLSEWISSFSVTLKKLSMAYTNSFNISSCKFPNLETLQLCKKYLTVDEYQTEMLSPTQFPALKFLSLNRKWEEFDDEDIFHLFDSYDAFPAVEVLNLIGAGGLRRDFESMFPNVKTLRIQGDILESDIGYVMSKYPKLINLSLIDFIYDDDWESISSSNYGKDLFYPTITGISKTDPSVSSPVVTSSSSQIPGGCQLSPTVKLNLFTELKMLEIGGRNLDAVLMSFIYLTAAKKIPPLEYFGIYGADVLNPKFTADITNREKTKLEKVNGFAKRGKIELEELNWHKKCSTVPILEVPKCQDQDPIYTVWAKKVYRPNME